MIGLTPQQAALLAFITNSIRDTGITPSYDEMKAHLGLRSKSGIHRLAIALEAGGHVRRIPKRARAIEVLKQPASRFDSYESGLQIVRAMNVPTPTRIARATLTNIKLVHPATAHASWHSLVGKEIRMTPVAKITHSGRRA